MRICCFQPGATEIVYALGLQDQLYGVTAQCDYPFDAQTKPVIVRSVFDNTSPSSGEITSMISERLRQGMGLYITDEEALRDANPDILLTQALCDVWALSVRQVAELGLTLKKNPQVISLDPELLGDVLEDIRRVGKATGRDDVAESLTCQLQIRIDSVTERAAQSTHRPKVLQLEWADPLLCGGHWVVEMVERAGGESCFGSKETGSSRLDWEKVIASQPEIIMLMPCGFDLKRAIEDVPLLLKLEGWDDIPAVRNDQVFIIDADAYTSRLGPRLVTGLEIMAEIIHPEVFSGMIPGGGAVKLSDMTKT